MFEDKVIEDWTMEREQLLQKKLNELGLKLEGSRLERLILRLHDELELAGIRFKPKVYLAEEWGCPDKIPIIGVPFYLADERLSRIEVEIMEGIEAESEEEILKYLRHEAGHAFNYAYRLYETVEWHKVFGPYSRPYRENYRPNAFSRNFVRHLPGWYAQKHPDEDFAETFAVWLTPDSNWMEIYKDWGCFKKLLYVESVVRKFGSAEPLVSSEGFDEEEDLNESVAEHYQKFKPQMVDVPAYFDGDLKDIFERRRSANEKDRIPAHQFLIKHRRELIRKITYWTGLDDTTVKSLIEHFIERCKILDLYVNPEKSHDVLLEVTVYTTTLCMNKLYKRDFIMK